MASICDRLDRIEKWIEGLEKSKSTVTQWRPSIHEIEAKYKIQLPITTLKSFQEFDKRLGIPEEYAFRNDVVSTYVLSVGGVRALF